MTEIVDLYIEVKTTEDSEAQRMKNDEWIYGMNEAITMTQGVRVVMEEEVVAM